MSILVTGANGQLGNELHKLSAQHNNWKFFFCDRNKVDITDKEAITAFVQENKITAIINCAAYTAVDLAESETAKARTINVQGAKNLAQVTAENNLKLIHVSTDFVFDGKHYLPYVESDTPNPLSVYGETKLQGEKEVLKACSNAIVIRTSWLYSAYGTNFVKTMQRLGNERTQLGVVFDQIGTPTWTGDLAQAILEILSQFKENTSGIYHFSNEGVASWYDFAVEIMELSKIDCKVLPIEAKEYPTPAYRPAYSVLNKSKIKRDFNLKIPYWKVSLKNCIEQITEL